jgi:hypothetical protein
VRSAELTVTGLAPGTFQVLLGEGSFAQRDTDTPPFVVDLPFAPSSGTLLATLTVVPEPTTALLTGLGLVGLAGARWRARHAGTVRQGEAPGPGL